MRHLARMLTVCGPKTPEEPGMVAGHIPSAHEDLVKQAEWLFSSQRKEPEAQQTLIQTLEHREREQVTGRLTAIS